MPGARRRWPQSRNSGVVILITDVFALQSYSRSHPLSCTEIRIEWMLDGSLVRVSPKIALCNRPAVHGPLQLLKVDSDNQVIAVIGIGTASAITQRRPRATCALLAILRNSGQNIAVPRLSLERPLSRPEFFCSFVPEGEPQGDISPGIS